MRVSFQGHIVVFRGPQTLLGRRMQVTYEKIVNFDQDLALCSK